MATRPLLTVIIATYNRSNVLPFSVGSVLRQTLVDFEILIVGDGCTDNSESVIETLGDARARWINLPINTGHQSEPNNEGLRQARGEYIAYLGHDDLWFPHHLSCMMAALNAGADLAFGITEVIGLEDSFRVAVPYKPEYRPGAWIPPTGIVHRRSVTDRVGGWQHYRELDVDPEIDLWRRAYDEGYKFAFVPRLTAIKLSASERPGVYIDKPHHEQAKWFERIHTERDLEAVELGRLLASAREASMLNETPYSQMLHDLLYETTIRVRRRLTGMRHRASSPARGEGVEARRVIKGLERKA